MIISQTPLRVSFAGGGTDLPAFYRQEEYGAVLSLTIQKHMYVTVHRRFESTTRVAYTKTEVADSIDELQHSIVRETLRHTAVDPQLEITTISDVPAGTGMGSSSSLTVGLLNAIYAYQTHAVSAGRLADDACHIEIDVLGKPIGRQDQYAAAFGGLNYFRLNPNDSVDVEPVPCGPKTISDLESWMLLFYTNQQRNADVILKQQNEGTNDRIPILRQMRDLADAMRSALCSGANLVEFARFLHESWELKRSLGFGITADRFDHMYDTARRAGALGGKLLGAGGGGFFLLMAPPDSHEAIRAALDRPTELQFAVDNRGSRIIFISDD